MARPSLRVERTCEVCGTVFAVPPCRLRQSPVRFCSHACRASILKKQPVPCAHCGAPFVPRAANKAGKYCSHSCWAKSRTGALHPQWKGGKQTSTCEHCGAAFEHQACRSPRFCSQSCLSSSRTGENAAHWQGGLTAINRRGRTTKAYYEWRAAVLTRDGNRCQNCNWTEPHMHVHHIKSYAYHPELRYDVDNGVTLCRECHEREHMAKT